MDRCSAGMLHRRRAAREAVQHLREQSAVVAAELVVAPAIVAALSVVAPTFALWFAAAVEDLPLAPTQNSWLRLSLASVKKERRHRSLLGLQVLSRNS